MAASPRRFRFLSVAFIVAAAVGWPQAAGATFVGEPGAIAFQRWSGASSSNADLFAIDVDGTNLRNLTESSVTWESEPSYSPDGRRLLYFGSLEEADYQTGVRDFKARIVLARADGTPIRTIAGPRRVSSSAVTIPEFASWSPDGTRIVFLRNWYGSGSRPFRKDVVIKRLGGTEKIVYTDSSDSWINFPYWSPDGKTLLWETLILTSQATSYLDIHVLDLATGRHRNLTKDVSGTWSPSWTPDGRILFTANRCGMNTAVSCADFFVMDRDGSNVERLTVGPHDYDSDGDQDHTWRARMSPDSAELLVLVNPVSNWVSEGTEVQKDEPLYRVDIKTGHSTLVVQDSDYSFDWQPRCTVMGTRGNDVLRGTPGRDLICGLGGDDVIYGLGGDDSVFGHGGADRIDGGGDRDIVVGGPGADACVPDESDLSRIC